MDQPSITMLYFASIRTSLVGEPDTEIIQLPSRSCTLYDLRIHLVRQVHRGNLEFERALERSMWSVDEEMVEVEQERDHVLRNGQTVCAIPPVSGG
ncbi:MoaD/ThiS family protein [Sporobolomyces koalae]|uniref:MoaD/ThiS family protein n=1 Tax=Sporobolomyces koalae TaxID=500713 RepID=UPI00317FF618